MTERIQTRHIAIFLAILVIVAGQILALVNSTAQLWPFHSIPPYAEFPGDFSKDIQQIVGVTPQGEVNLSKIMGTNYGVLKRYYMAMGRAQDDDSRQMIASRLLEYVNGISSAECSSFRVYRHRWDLSAGVIVNSTLEAEYY
tara:strand:- start:52 stop:477 length:426 start_codon:yes stop_codon:yes gene_type:complete